MSQPKRDQSNWTQVRVRKDVHARLLTLQDQLTRQAAAKGAQYPWLDKEVSFSDVILTLLFRNDAHAARSKSASQRRKKAKDRVD